MLCTQGFVALHGALETPPVIRLQPSRRHPQFWYRTSGAELWVDNRYKPVSRQTIFAAQVQSHSKGARWLHTDGNLQFLCEKGHLDQAVDLLFSMDEQGSVPSVDAYRCLLRACTKRKAFIKARHVHAHLAQHGLEFTEFLGESAVSTLVKCGDLEYALKVFHRLPHRDVHCWTVVIAGYANAGNAEEAQRMYEEMLEKGVDPSPFTFVSLLKSCRRVADLETGRHIHLEALKHRCESHPFVAAALIDMYLKCGSVMAAQRTFDEMCNRDVVSWNVMLAAYADEGQPEKTLQLYEKMREEGVSPDVRTVLSTLRACGMLAETESDSVVGDSAFKAKSLTLGRAIHAEAWRKGYNGDKFVVSTLVSMYGKHGSPLDARNAFAGSLQHDVVSWTAMLTACNRHPEVAATLYGQMMQEGVCPDPHSFVCIVQAYCKLAESEPDAMLEGQSIKITSMQICKVMHADAWRKGFESDAFVANSLICMFSKCGSTADAENLFIGLSKRDQVSWTAMLAAYNQQGQAAKSLQLYIEMLEEGVSPDIRTFVVALQACAIALEKEVANGMDELAMKVKPLEMGKAIHANAWRKGYDVDVFVGSTLIAMYGKSGSIHDAKIVFCGMPLQNVVSWTAMLSASFENGDAERTLELFRSMQNEGVSPDAQAFLIVMQACGILAEEEKCVILDGQPTKVESLAMGKAFHAQLWSKGLDFNRYLGSIIISMYGKCGSILDAQTVFDGLSDHNVVSWNAMLVAMVEQRDGVRALQVYVQMLERGPSPNDRTYVSAIQVCGILAEKEAATVLRGRRTKMESLSLGKLVHGHAITRGYEADAFLGSALVTMYGKCGSMSDAEYVFSGSFNHNVVAWTSMLDVYVVLDEAEKALNVYLNMQHEGFSPDVPTLLTALQACCRVASKEVDTLVNGRMVKVKALALVKEMHADACIRGHIICDVVGTALVDIYVKCKSFADACVVFNSLCKHDVVAWNSMLRMYAEHAEAEETLQLYRQMQEQGVSPNEFTQVTILQACCKTGSLSTLKQIHQLVVSSEKDLSPSLSNKLIVAYGKCASMTDAQTVFDNMSQHDVVSWTSLISGYARQGFCTPSLQCYEEMRQQGIEPDGVTFLAVLCACSHGGLVDQGVDYFECMSRDHGITPDVEHYLSLVDLFGRAGDFTRLKDLLGRMPVQPDLAIWLGVLGACQKHGEVELGEYAFGCAVRLQPKHPAAYVLLSNIYANAGRLDLAKWMKRLRLKEGAWKKPGQAWIEHALDVHRFQVLPKYQS